MKKVRHFFLLVAGVLLIAFSISGCAFIPTVGYFVFQFAPDLPEEKERIIYEWPCGNIIHLNTVMIREILDEPDDEVLPPDLHRALQVFCIAQGYPVSLVYDVVLWPYELWRYYHQPPLTEEEIKRHNAARLNIDMPREIRRNEPFTVRVSFAGNLEGKNLIYRRGGQNFKVVFVAPVPHRHEAVAVLKCEHSVEEPVEAGKVYEEVFKVDVPELASGRRYTVEVEFIPDKTIRISHEKHQPRWVQVRLVADPKTTVRKAEGAVRQDCGKE